MNFKINTNPSLLWLFSLFVLCIVLVYPPFVFFQFMNESFRIVVFASVLIILFVIQINSPIKRNKFSKILFLWFCAIVYFFSSILINGLEGARTSIGYVLILFFGILLFSIFQSEKNNKLYKFTFNLYIVLFSIVPIFCICNFILNLITPSINILTPYFSYFTYNYSASPFGLSIPKSFLGINFTRNFFFFIEPVYLAFFYLLNVFIVGKHISKYSRIFIYLNIFGGFLTASFFFFFGYLILKFINISILKKATIILVLVFLSFFYYNTVNDFFSESSSEERFSRIELGIVILKNYNFEKLLFGTGYLFDHEVSKGFSSGFLTSFIEGGIIGLLIPLLIAILFCQRKSQLILVVILSLILFEPYKMPFFWYVIVIVGNLNLEDNNIAPKNNHNFVLEYE